MSKESVRKFLEDVKKDSDLQDIRRGLNKGKTKVGLVNYLTEEANQRGYEFTAVELEEELLPWLLSAQEVLETPQESREDADEKLQSIQEPIEQTDSREDADEKPQSIQEPIKQLKQPESRESSQEKLQSIQEPIEQPESTKKSTQKSVKMTTKKSTKASTEASTEALSEISIKVSTEAPSEVSIDIQTNASEKIAAEIPTTSCSTSQMLSLMAVSQPKESPVEPTKITALEKVVEKVQKGKLPDLNGRIWA